MIRRIYLDLDDVLNTLSMYFLSLVGCKVDPRDYRQYPVTGDVCMSVVANQLLGGEYFTRPSFWAWFNRHDWASVPKSDECDWLIEQCERLVGWENVMIATSPTKDGACAAGKIDWIHANLPPWLHRQYAITPRKWFLAQRGALLIDDNTKNVRLFKKGGGRTLLVPRPWNRLHASWTPLVLVEKLGRLMARQGEFCKKS
jgi:hypothetical protein